MRRYNRKRKVFAGILLLCVGGYLLWSQRPVTIIRAGERFEYDPTLFHGLYVSSKRGFTDNNAYDIAVDHLALTEWGRIQWYLSHRDELKKKHHIPTSASYHIAFWDIGDGFTDYKSSGDSDLYCLPLKKTTEKNCIEKNMLMRVGFDKGYYEKFSFSGSDYYWITMPNGTLVRIKNA